MTTECQKAIDAAEEARWIWTNEIPDEYSKLPGIIYDLVKQITDLKSELSDYAEGIALSGVHNTAVAAIKENAELKRQLEAMLIPVPGGHLRCYKCKTVTPLDECDLWCPCGGEWETDPETVRKRISQLEDQLRQYQQIQFDPDFVADARRILSDLEQNGDPFDGTDWSLVQILRQYIFAAETLDLKEHK